MDANMQCVVTAETFDKTYPELEPLYRAHFAELKARYDRDGIAYGEWNPQFGTYSYYTDMGLLITFIARLAGQPVGYANIYLLDDIHTGEKIASEDAIYVTPEQRGAGAGNLIVRFVHAHLKALGVKRLNITTSTDLKVANWLAVKHGYKHTAHCMTVEF